MPVPKVTALDWRDQFQQLEPFFEGRGGVVHVEYAGARCAPEAFVATVSHLYEDRDRTNLLWRSARIDRNVWNVRYLAGVLRILERKLGLPASAIDPPETPRRSTLIASENTAEGNMSVKVDVHHLELVSGDEYAFTARKEEGVARVSAAMGEHLPKGGFLLVLMAHMADDASDFWRDCWADDLGDHLHQGLVLMKMVNTSEPVRARHPDEPAPDLIVQLPERLDGKARSDAEEDLAALLRKHFSMAPAESALATTSFMAGKDSVQRIHNELLALWADLARHLPSHGC